MSAFARGLRPEDRLTVDEWADKNRYLSASASAEPGRWRTDRTPYLREILQKLSAYDPTREIIFKKGAQVGATEAGNCWIGYVIDASPGPMMMVMPTDATIKRNSQIRIDPMIESTPVLSAKVAPARSRDSKNTTVQKSFPGGVLVMAGANSAVGLRSMPVRFLFLDEVDGYPRNLDKEGSPVDLAKARTRTFPNRKIFIVSTPVLDGQSVIQSEFEKTDQRFYNVPCPHCGLFQRLVFDNLRYETEADSDGNPRVIDKSVSYECEGCSNGILERHKPNMLAAGEWIAAKPGNASWKKVGYHLNSLYAPLGWFSWADIAQQYEDIGDDEEKEKTFTNTILGLEWTEKGEAPKWQNLFNRREDYKPNAVPNAVAVITAGVDIQKDRIELEIVGWAPGLSSYSLDYRVLMGDTSADAVWNELAKVVSETWQRADGLVLPLSRMAVDTGYNTAEVYKFCRRFMANQVLPIKGQEKQTVMLTPPRSVDRRGAKGKVAGTLGLWNIAVSVIKSELYGRLKLERNEDGTAPLGYCHFPTAYDAHYFKMLTAEELQARIVKGYTIHEWVKTYVRNEALDCRVYARAAAAQVGIDRWAPHHWKAATEGLTYVRPEPAKKPTASVGQKKSFWD